MKKLNKRVKVLCTAVMLTVGILSGCQKDGGETPAQETVENTGTEQLSNESQKGTSASMEEKVMGRYLEEDVILPEGTTSVIAMASQTEGGVRLAASDKDGNRAVWNSVDKGNTWTKESDFPEDIRSEQTVYFYKAAMSENGEMAFIRSEGEGNFSYIYMDKDMKTKVLDLFPTSDKEAETEERAEGDESSEYAANTSERLTEIQFAQNGKLIALGNKCVYSVDTKEGVVDKTYEQGNEVSGFYTAGNTLIIFSLDEIKLYDLESGKQLEKDKVLEEHIKSDNAAESLGQNSSSLPLLFAKGQEKDSLYYCYKNGLYSHTLGGNISEQVIDGKLSSLSSPSIGFLSMAVLDETTFLVSCTDNGVPKIFRFVYSSDTPTVPGTEIKVYSLNENNEVRQAIALFQKANPDICVTLEIGMTGEDAVTYSDALRTLNTNIMADKGPDLLVLDGMPIDSYIEKGILEELGTIMKELENSNGFLENIQKAYETDGQIMAIPSRFKVPAIQSDKSSLEVITDLKTLADQGEVLKQENSELKKVLEMSQIGIFINNLYNISSKSWEKEDRSLDQEKITEFFTQLKRLYSLDDHTGEEEFDNTIGGAMDSSNPFGNITAGVIGMMGKQQQINIGEMASINDLAMVTSSNEKMKDISYQILNGQSEKIFIPNTILGISARATHKEEAFKFVSFMLSTEIQELNQGGGFPVNRAAFESMMENKTDTEGMGSIGVSSPETGEGIMLDIMWPSDDEIKRFKEYAESLTTPPLTDSIIRETVIEQVKRCLTEDVSVEDAVKNVMQKVNLYLMES